MGRMGVALLLATFSVVLARIGALKFLPWETCLEIFCLRSTLSIVLARIGALTFLPWDTCFDIFLLKKQSNGCKNEKDRY